MPLLLLLKSPKVIAAAVIFAFCVFMLISNQHLKTELANQNTTIQTQSLQVSSLTKRVDDDAKKIIEIQQLEADRKNSLNDINNKISNQSAQINTFRKTHSVDNLKQIQKSSGDAGLESALNKEFQDRIHCIELISKGGDTSCANSSQH